MLYSRNLIAALILTLTLSGLNAATYKSNANGNWTGSVWTNSASSKNKYVINANHTITLNSTVINIDTLLVYGNLSFASNRSLVMNSNSIIIVFAGGTITGASANSLISFTGSPLGTISGPWNGSSTVNGPKYATGSTKGFVPYLTALVTKVIRFDASSASNSTMINWDLVRNPALINCELQASENGETFSSIASFNEFNENNVQNFSFSDENTYQVNVHYYRLKFTENDGSVSYSDLISFSGRTEKVVSAYPNPAVDVLHINIQKIEDGDAKLSIKNISGSTLTTVSDFSSPLEIDVTSFEKGIYFIEFENAGRLEVSKFIVR